MAEKTLAEKKASSLKRKNALIGYSFIAPNFIGFAIFILFPVLFTLVLSVMNWDGFNAMTFAGMANFKSIFRDRVFKSSFWLTLLYVVCTVVLTLLASLGLACALNKKIKGRDAFRAAIFFPYVASMIAIGAVWKQLFESNNGPINHLLRSIGISNPPGWFASTDWAIYGVIIVAIWKFMGYYMLDLRTHAGRPGYKHDTAVQLHLQPDFRILGLRKISSSINYPLRHRSCGDNHPVPRRKEIH